MRAVVTGASGHLGVNLVDRLVAEGHGVTAVVRGDARWGRFDSRVRQVVAELGSAGELRRAMVGSEVVFHLAGKISLTADVSGEVWQTNVEGTRAVVEAALSEGVRLVHCSSVHALNDRVRMGESLDESFPLWRAGETHAVYHQSKAEAERLVLAAIKRGLDATIVRPTGVWGGRDLAPSRLGRVLLDAARGQLFALTTGGFDFVDVRDVAASMIRAALTTGLRPSYMLGGHFVSLADLAERAARAEGVSPPAFVVPHEWVRPLATVAEGVGRLFRFEPNLTRQALDTIARGRPVDSSAARADIGHAARPPEETLSHLLSGFRERGMLS